MTTNAPSVRDDLPASLLGWVRENGQDCDGLVRIAGDASFKSYFRLQGCKQPIIAMYAPPPDSVERYQRMGGIVTRAGLRTPRVLATDHQRGFALIEDLGDDRYDLVVGREPERAQELRRLGWRAIARLQKNVRREELPASYDDALLDRELAMFPEWYASIHKSSPLNDREQSDYNAICVALKANFFAQCQTYVHRDFHSRNLFAVEPIPAVIDFSDAVWGPCTYDIASFLRDLYLDMDEEEGMDHLVRHWELCRSFGIAVAEDFGEHYRAYEWTSLQRHLKILGLFVRLERRDGKSGFLAHLPKCERMSHATALRYRDLRPVALMIEKRAT